MKLILTLAILIAINAANLENYTFQQYAQQFGKVYSKEEIILR